MTQFKGVPMEQVGPVFDIAIGYLDPNADVVNMVGYTVSPSGNYQTGTDVTDEQHIVQISSPNSTDRVARWPQASQGDWSKGERQRVFQDGAMFYQTDGNIDVSTPGNLTLFPGIRTDTFGVDASLINGMPVATDGTLIYFGLNSGGHNFAECNGGAPSLYTVANGHEIVELLYTPFALLALTDQGVWVIVAGPPPTDAHLVVDALTDTALAQKSMAYLEDNVYWVKNSRASSSGVIRMYNRTDGTTVDAITATASECFFTSICSWASGIFFSTSSKLPFQSFFYAWSGSPGDLAQRIYDVQGRVEYAIEALGTIYVLVRQFQAHYYTHPQWTLYAVTGSNVQVVDDARALLDVNFEPKCTSVKNTTAESGGDFKPMMWSDGRFLYISWPGLATRRIDLINGGISQVGPNQMVGVGPVAAHRFITSVPAPFVDLVSYAGSAVVSQMSLPSTTGQLISSFYDFGSPGTGKIFRSVELQTVAPLVGAQALQVLYRLNQDAGFTPLPVRQIGPRNFSAVFPNDIKGTEVQIIVQPVAGASGPPSIADYSVIADLGRIINITVACRRRQQSRNQEGIVDAQNLTAQQLQANVLNIRNLGGGRCYLYIPDPTVDDGVSSIQARLIDYQIATPNGAAPGLRPGEDGVRDQEADILVQLAESFDL